MMPISSDSIRRISIAAEQMRQQSRSHPAGGAAADDGDGLERRSRATTRSFIARLPDRRGARAQLERDEIEIAQQEEAEQPDRATSCCAASLLTPDAIMIAPSVSANSDAS
jgi:hypothetical protein